MWLFLGRNNSSVGEGRKLKLGSCAQVTTIIKLKLTTSLQSSICDAWSSIQSHQLHLQDMDA